MAPVTRAMRRENPSIDLFSLDVDHPEPRMTKRKRPVPEEETTEEGPTEQGPIEEEPTQTNKRQKSSENPPENPPREPPTLLTIPMEIKWMIFPDVLHPPEDQDLPRVVEFQRPEFGKYLWPKFHKWVIFGDYIETDILKVCRQTYADTFPMLYGECEFHLPAIPDVVEWFWEKWYLNLRRNTRELIHKKVVPFETEESDPKIFAKLKKYFVTDDFRPDRDGPYGEKKYGEGEDHQQDGDDNDDGKKEEGEVVVVEEKKVEEEKVVEEEVVEEEWWEEEWWEEEEEKVVEEEEGDEGEGKKGEEG